jgi:excisionase family DNA binding protein
MHGVMDSDDIQAEQTVAPSHASLHAYLNYKELSADTGISVSTLRRRVQAGQLPFFQPGGRRTRVVFPADLVERLLQSPTESPALSPETPPPPTNAIRHGPPPKWIRETSA